MTLFCKRKTAVACTFTPLHPSEQSPPSMNDPLMHAPGVCMAFVLTDTPVVNVAVPALMRLFSMTTPCTAASQHEYAGATGSGEPTDIVLRPSTATPTHARALVQPPVAAVFTSTLRSSTVCDDSAHTPMPMSPPPASMRAPVTTAAAPLTYRP